MITKIRFRSLAFLLALAFSFQPLAFSHLFADPPPATFYQFNGGASATIGSGTSITLARLGSVSSYNLTLASGTSPYTANLSLSDAGIHAGDVYLIAVSYPASTNPTLSVFDSGTSGTLLDSSTGSAVAGSTTLEFVNTTGTAWVAFHKGAILTRNIAAGVLPALGAAPNSAAGFVTGSGLANGTAGYSVASGLKYFYISGTAPGDTALSASNGSISANVALGSSSSTVSCSLPYLNHTSGDIAMINVTWPGASYAKFKVYDNNPATGTVLWAYQTIGSGAQAALLFQFNGSAWIPFGTNAVISTGLSPILWLKADALSTGSGGSVADWSDQSGNGNDAMTSGTYGTPLFLPNQINGHGAVVFNGTNQLLSTANPIFSGTFARMMIAVYETTSTNNSLVGGICGESRTDATGDWFSLQTRVYGAVGDPYFAGYSADVTASTAPLLNTWEMATVLWDGTNLTLYHNGVYSASATLSLNTASSPFDIGCANFLNADSGGRSFFPGKIAEIIILPSASQQDRLNEESYLTTKYALP
jgi:hypothetical protein